MRPLTLGRLLLRCGILAAILFVVVVIALKLGAVQVSLYGLGRDLIRVLLGQSSSISSDYGMIVVDIRLPRILLAIVVGASLSVAGASFQALLRNPLADPYVLGVSSGAAVGSIIALLIANQLSFSPRLPGCSRRSALRWAPAPPSPRFIFWVGATAASTAALSFSAESSPHPSFRRSSCF